MRKISAKLIAKLIGIVTGLAKYQIAACTVLVTKSPTKLNGLTAAKLAADGPSVTDAAELFATALATAASN